MTDPVMPPAPAPSPSPSVSPEEALTLEEFCIRLSVIDRRVELIGGFHSDEKRALRFKDLDSAYAARYQDFINRAA